MGLWTVCTSRQIDRQKQHTKLWVICVRSENSEQRDGDQTSDFNKTNNITRINHIVIEKVRDNHNGTICVCASRPFANRRVWSN